MELEAPALLVIKLERWLMRRSVLGACVCVVLILAAAGLVGQHGEVFAQRVPSAIAAAPPAPAPAAVVGSELIVVPAALGDKGQVLTVIDPQRKVLSVYHIDLTTGKITLRSARNIQWDLQIEELNTDTPSPREIRSMLQPR
jgi:hypothetical protein